MFDFRFSISIVDFRVWERKIDQEKNEKLGAQLTGAEAHPFFSGSDFPLPDKNRKSKSKIENRISKIEHFFETLPNSNCSPRGLESTVRLKSSK